MPFNWTRYAPQPDRSMDAVENTRLGAGATLNAATQPAYADPADPRLVGGGYYDKSGKWNLLPMDAQGRRGRVPADATMPPSPTAQSPFGPQPGMNDPNAAPPSGYGNPTTSPNYRTTRAGGSPTFNPGMPTVPTRHLPPNTPQTAVPFPTTPYTPGARTPTGAQKPRNGPQPGAFVAIDDGSVRVLGGNSIPLPYDDDPMAGDRQLVSSRGLTQDEFDGAMLPQNREALSDAIIEAGQVPGSRYASIGAELSRLRRAQGEALSADNMDPDERAQAAEMLRRRESELLYAAAQDTSPLLSERHRSLMQRQQQDRMDQREMKAALDQHAKEMERGRQKLWDESMKRAQEELYSPTAPIDPDQLRARAMQHYAAGGGDVSGASMDGQQQGSEQAGNLAITPGDELEYMIDESGRFVAEDADGNVYGAVAFEGRAMVMPRSAEEIDALPAGTAYATWGRPDANGNQRIEMQVKKGEGTRGSDKGVPAQDEVDREIRSRAESAVERRTKEFDRYEEAMREYRHQVEQGKTPLEPRKPRALEDAEAAHRNSRAFVEGKDSQFTPDAVMESDIEAASKSYYEEKGTTAEDMSMARMAEEASRYRRSHNGAGMQVRVPGGGDVFARRIKVGDRTVMAPIAGTAEQAMWLIKAGTPHVTRGKDGKPTLMKSGVQDSPLLQEAARNPDKALRSTMQPGKNPGVVAVRDFVATNFGYLDESERKALMRDILTGLRYTGQ